MSKTWVAQLNLSHNASRSILSDENVVENHLDDLDLVLEANGFGEDGADHFLKFLSGLEEFVGGGGGYSNNLQMVVEGEPLLRNQRLEEHCVEGVTEGMRCGTS